MARMKQLFVAVLSILLFGGCSKSDKKDSASGGEIEPIKSSRDLAKVFFAQLASGNKQAVLKVTLLGASENVQNNFLNEMGATGDQGERALQKIKNEKAKFLDSGIDALIASMKKEGIDPAKVKLGKVETSGIGKLPSADGGKGVLVGGELVLHFTAGGRPVKAVVVINCAKLKEGWVIVDAPEVSLTRGSRAKAGPGPGGPGFPGRPSLGIPGGMQPALPGGLNGFDGGGGAEATTEYDDNWTTDLPAAIRLAKKENKRVFIDFTGSDWCPPCMALHRNVLTKRAFLEYAKEHLVLVVLDFPKRKPQAASLRRANDALSKRYRVDGFPTVIVLDANGKMIHRESGYSGDGAAAFVAKLKTKTSQ